MVLACADLMCWHGKGSAVTPPARQPAGATGPRPAPLRFRSVSGGTAQPGPQKQGGERRSRQLWKAKSGGERRHAARSRHGTGLLRAATPGRAWEG